MTDGQGRGAWASAVEALEELWFGTTEERTVTWSSQTQPWALPVAALVTGIYGRGWYLRHSWDAGYQVESHPVLRLVWESAIVASWLALGTEEQAAQFWDAGERQTWKLMAGATKAGVALPADLEAKHAQLQKQRFSDLQFRSVCDDLEGGDAFYLIFASLSAESHPGLGLVNAHVELDEARQDFRSFHTTARGGDRAGDDWTLACALMWSATAVDDLTPGHPVRGDLERIASDYENLPRSLRRTS